MKLLKTGDEEFHLVVSKDEFSTVINCLNEVCHGIDAPEFQTRIGQSKALVEEMLQRMSLIFDS